MKKFFMEVQISGATDHNNLTKQQIESMEKLLKEKLRIKWENELIKECAEIGIRIREFSPITMTNLEII